MPEYVSKGGVWVGKGAEEVKQPEPPKAPEVQEVPVEEKKEEVKPVVQPEEESQPEVQATADQPSEGENNA